MPDKKINVDGLIEDYLRLVHAGDLGHEGICELLNINPDWMKTILASPINAQFIGEKLKEFGLTFSDTLALADSYFQKGFSDEEIAWFLNIPLEQVRFRRRWKEKGYV